MLTYNIKKIFQNQKILTALAFDIKTTFDKVTDAKLVQKL